MRAAKSSSPPAASLRPPAATEAPLSPAEIYQHESTDTQICNDTGRLAAKVLYMKAVIKFVTAEAQAAALWVEELRGRFFPALKHEN